MKQIKRTGRVQGTEVQFRFTNTNGQTEVWILPADTVDMTALKQHVTMAGIDDGTDDRLKRQRESIERLLEHLQHHCDDVFNCERATHV